MKKILVVPSNRPHSFDSFMDAWADSPARDWDALILVEDGPTRSINADRRHSVDYHFCWADVEDTLGQDQWVISRRNSAIRNFGLLIAHQLGADLVVTLDDDCYPADARPFCQSHLDQMTAPRWIESVPNFRTRGLPYRNRGTTDTIKLSMGLWSNVPDLDAPQSLADMTLAAGGWTPPGGSRIMPSGQYWPLCGMNLAVRREALPLCYFPLMGQGSPYDRFDDIWMGIWAQKIAAHLGWQISAGEPWVQHSRASDIMVNLVKEAPGIAANEHFWQIIDAARLTERTPTGCMAELGRALAFGSDPYIHELGQALQVWAGLF